VRRRIEIFQQQRPTGGGLHKPKPAMGDSIYSFREYTGIQVDHRELSHREQKSLYEQSLAVGEET
jgi:hypothetical protein